jgi:endonuclease YncB( thermonuclease family)
MEEFKYFNNDTPIFTMNGMKTFARVVNVIDGDTLSLVIPLFDNYFKFSVRIYGIDTCEVHSNDVEIKDKGLKAKYRVIEMLSKKDIKDVLCISRKQIIELFNTNISIVWIECLDFDKYGRLLGNVFFDNKTKNIADILISEKLAYRYDGGTKLTEEQQKQEIK